MHAYLPVLGVPLKKKGRLWLTNLADVVVLNALYVLGSLDTVILGESTGVSLLFRFVSNWIKKIILEIG